MPLSRGDLPNIGTLAGDLLRILEDIPRALRALEEAKAKGQFDAQVRSPRGFTAGTPRDALEEVREKLLKALAPSKDTDSYRYVGGDDDITGSDLDFRDKVTLKWLYWLCADTGKWHGASGPRREETILQLVDLVQTLGSTKLRPRGPKAVGRRGRQPKRKNGGSVADIVFVTVNEHETQALLAAVRAQTNAGHTPVATEARLYNDLGTINGTRIFHMICKMGSGGVGGSQEAVGQCIRELRPMAVIAVGIAFGVNYRGQTIGDVLVSTQLSLYDLQKVATAKNGKKKYIKIIPRGSKPDASPWPVNFFSTYHQTAWKGGTVRFGTILTGEKLVDNVDFRDQLIALQQEAIGGEMEGAGLYVSSTTNKTDWIVIKAICDWADGNKKRDKEARQKLAAANAAAFVVGALSHAPFIGKSPPAGVLKGRTID